MTRCCVHAQSINASTHEFDARVTHGGEAHAPLGLLATKFFGVTARICELTLHCRTSSPARMLCRCGAQGLYKPRSGFATMSAPLSLFPSGSTVVTARMESRVLVKGAIVRHHFATRGDPSAARSIAPRYTEVLSVAGRGALYVCGHLNDTNHTALAVWRRRSEIRAVDWLGADGCNRLRGCAPPAQSSQGVVATCGGVSCQPRWSTRHTVNAG